MNPRVVEVMAWHPEVPGWDLGDDLLSWQDKARCAEIDWDLFFPERGEPAQPAKRVCRGCEVRAECLEFALANGEEHGIWAGLTERELRDARLNHAGLPAEEILALADDRARQQRERAAAHGTRRLAAERGHRKETAAAIANGVAA